LSFRKKKLERFAGMPLPEAEEDHSNVPNIIAEELNYDRSALGQYLRINECLMNEDQKFASDHIFQSIDPNCTASRLFFLFGWTWWNWENICV
jgi:hypothetical protein